MKRETFIIKTGIIDSNNDVIMPGALKMDKEKYMVLANYSIKPESIIGTAKVNEIKEESVINIDAELYDQINSDLCDVGLMFLVTESEKKEEITEITEGQLLAVSLYPKGNQKFNI